MEHLKFPEGYIQKTAKIFSEAEELAGNHFKLSTTDWKRFKYDVKTLKDLDANEISNEAFATLSKYTCRNESFDFGQRTFSFYKICLQDHNILRALKRDPDISFEGLILYIAVHELIHIIRFNRFVTLFDSDESAKREEERIVHTTTLDILRATPLFKDDLILSSYEKYTHKI
jgi:hypothetical protein